MEDKKSVLRHSLVGFLKSRMEGVKVVESWLYNYWGKMAVRIKLLDEKAVERSGGSALCDGWVFFPFYGNRQMDGSDQFTSFSSVGKDVRCPYACLEGRDFQALG